MKTTQLINPNTMKKILPLLLLFTGLTNAQNLTFPDTYFKSVLLSASPTVQIAQDFNDQWIKIDANNDGEIQESEAQAVKVLGISELLVFNVTGINGFSNLEELRFSSSLITTLDISGLPNLKSLSCVNMQILSTLNLNGATNLTSLSCFGLPMITTLNIGNLTNLTKLYCVNTSIATFNVNGLTNLDEILYSGNQLTTVMNVSGLTSLTKLNCGFNKLTTLTLNGLTALTDLNCSNNQLTNLNGLPNLIKLNCENNKLTSLNINSVTTLNELSCGGNEITSLNVSGLTNLTTLSCINNKFTSFSLNGLSNLVTLDCSGNNLLTNVTLSNLPALQDFKVVSTIDMNMNSLSHLTSLTLSGLPNLQKLNCSNGILTSLNLNGLTNLTEVICSRNQLSSLNVSNLPNLQKLICNTNPISSLDVSNMPNLIELSCAGGYAVNSIITGELTTLNVSGSINLKKLSCSYSLLTTLNLTGLINLEELNCEGIFNNAGHLSSLDVNGLTSLKRLSCSGQQLTSLNVSNLTNLETLYCSYNHITDLDLTGLVNLKNLDYSYNQLANLNLVNLPSLEILNCSNNYLVTLNVLNLTNLKSLYCTNNNLTTLNLSGLNSLETLDYSYNELTFSNVAGLSTNLKSLSCAGNNLTSLDISGLTSLELLNCSNNQITNLDLFTLTNLKTIDCSLNELPTLIVGYATNLESLNCAQNLLTDLNIAGLNYITLLYCGRNQLTNLDLTNHTNLRYLDYSENAIPNLDVSSLTNLVLLGCASTQSTELDVSNLIQLQSLSCSNNQLTTLDVNNSPWLNELGCDNNQLTTLFLKNGRNEQYLSFSNNPLQYICADTVQLESIQSTLNSLGMNTTVSNSYCTFSPGGNHNTINGIVIFDADNNGCDVTDVVNPFVRFDVNDGSATGATVTNINGTYNYFTDAGIYTIAPNVENPTWFDFSPPSANFNFLSTNNNIATQNFCIAAVGIHNDIEVVFAPLEPARPGFDAKYKVVFKNKGNQMHSGTVTLTFDDARTDLINSDPAPDTTIPNSMVWNYTNLMPFENRSIIVTLNLNNPTETPALNNGDILNFTAAITPVTGDEIPADNQYTFNQTVVGSYDPNTIECLEGELVSPTEIGNYLHYAINFENLGTFYAENIVVRSEIDPTKYDISTLQVMNTSHASYTRISGNTVEFVFQGINLAAATGTPPVGGHGDVLFKIKTNDNLVNNDRVLQNAGIYFDYNFPVVTNDAETTFAALSNPVFEQDNSVKIYPNPTNSIINIDSDFPIQTIELYDIQGRILETHFEEATSFKLDISGKSNGIYFIKIKTDKGSKVEKIVKK
jgi:Leucine-rich repeat (LRR) protein